jgi:CBS domain-containing protein
MMIARDLMTKDVISVSADTPVDEISKLLLARGISAAPVLDAAGAVIGMVSEGDLIARDEEQRKARRDWWLAMLAEGEELHPDFLKTIRRPQQTARQMMSTPVITVSETTKASEIARILMEHRIKRVPVVRDGRVVGIVSRANLLQALAEEKD